MFHQCLGDVFMWKDVIFYDILLKINIKGQQFEINENLIVKYFNEFDDNNRIKYKLFDQYFSNFYHFCFELSPKNMIKDALKFKDK